MAAVLQLNGVHKTYRRGDEQVHVLVDFDFTLEAGEFVVVTGPSGAGKSTLLHIAGGLDAPDSGTVAVTGQDVWSMSTGARATFRRRNLGFVFQFFNLVPMLTAVENVSLPLVLDGVSAREADARAIELLHRIGLGDRARHRPAELSGGQMQRVAVARRWWPGRRSFLPTSRPEISTVIPRPKSWVCCGRCPTKTARPS
ncbi:putative Phosphonate-transporting ATPase [uncultured Mycobacterium sp.]|uniref:Putative Phosphonate-transporting ATPase n=1 Tax=uncultured Mycobacterium sp. TaxID=171292 RepID=A0A1Y5PFZ6_9MYCO|nr:putative Phosphonate-transporting ATPase [uncultured Mycobacterium sp.]